MKADDKVFYALFSSSLLFAISTVGYAIYFPIFLWELELGYSMIGILGATTGIGGAILQLLLGVYSDKKENLNKKKVLVTSILIRSLFFMTFHSLQFRFTY